MFGIFQSCWGGGFLEPEGSETFNVRGLGHGGRGSESEAPNKSIPSKELSISKKNPRAEGLDKIRGGVHARFAAGLPFPVPQILEFAAFRVSGQFFQQFTTPHVLGVQETVLLVNHALARGTPAIFVIFVVKQGVRSANPLFYWLECRFVIFAIFVKNPLFLAGQKHGLPKAPFSGPRKRLLVKSAIGNKIVTVHKLFWGIVKQLWITATVVAVPVITSCFQ